MRLALKVARQGAQRPSSEPLAGAVIVSGEKVAGSGSAGAAQAESAISAALAAAGPLAAGAVVYSTVWPGCDAPDPDADLARLIAIHPERIVIGTTGTRPSAPDGAPAGGEAAARAIARLTAAGIAVKAGVCERECFEANERYFKYARTGLPFVTVKFAETLDGRIATATGDSQWISGPASLRLAHQLRREHDAIMVGIRTVLRDDPRLTVRLVNGSDPLRVIVDSHLRIPQSARVLAEGAAHRTLIATTRSADGRRASDLEVLGAEVVVLPRPAAVGAPGGPAPAATAAGEAAAPSGVPLGELLALLGRRRVASVLVEGGASIITSLLAAGLVDRLVVIVAPKIVGHGIAAIGDLGVSQLQEAIQFTSVKTRKLGSDVIFDLRK